MRDRGREMDGRREGGKERMRETGKEGGRKREGDINLLFHSFMHSLADSCVPDQESNLQPWCIGTIIKTTEPPGQGKNF